MVDEGMKKAQGICKTVYERDHRTRLREEAQEETLQSYWVYETSEYLGHEHCNETSKIILITTPVLLFSSVYLVFTSTFFLVDVMKAPQLAPF